MSKNKKVTDSRQCRECGKPTTNPNRYHHGCTPHEVYLGGLFR